MPAATFGHVARELGGRGIAFICAGESPGPNRIGAPLNGPPPESLHVPGLKATRTIQRFPYLRNGRRGLVKNP